MRHRSALYFTGLLIAIVGFLMLDYSLRAQYVFRSASQATASKPVNTTLPSIGEDLQLRAQFLTIFQDFVAKMNAVSDEPERSDELLQKFSNTIKPSDVVVLNEVLNDIKLTSSERTLALELLINHQDFNVHNLLNNFVQNENFDDLANVDLEIALRAQAIEGLTPFTDKKLVRKNLENLKVRTRYAFLYDRADRAIAYLSDQNLATQMDSADAKASTR